MRCYGEFKDDRTCDICKVISIETRNDMYYGCQERTRKRDFVRSNFKYCTNYYEETTIEEGTNSLGYDEEYECIHNLCSLDNSSKKEKYKCVPMVDCCYEHIMEGRAKRND